MPSPDERVAIVMITHNRRDEVLRSLGKLIALPEQPAIYLVDNGSSDGTAAAVRAVFPMVEIIDAGGNLGAAGRNLGVMEARAPYVAFCDDDTWWDAGDLTRGADIFDAHPRVAILTARILVGPEEVEDPICQVLAGSPLPKRSGASGPRLLGFLAGASIVRRTAFLAAGGFAWNSKIGGEENLLAADIASLGYFLCYEPALTVHHYPSALRDSEARRAYEVRNGLWFAWMRRPLASAVRSTLRTIRAGWNRAADRRGVAQAIAGAPAALLRRRVVSREVEQDFRLLESQPPRSEQPAPASLHRQPIPVADLTDVLPS